MNWINLTKTWLRSLFSRRKYGAEMGREALLAASRRPGRSNSINNQGRDRRGFRWFENLVQDIRFGARQLRKNPGFTAVALVTLALGMGANTTIFSMVNSVLLRSLPYSTPDRLVAVCENNPGLGWRHYVTSLGAYSDWRAQSSVFQDLAGALVLGPTPMVFEGRSEMVHAASVSSGFFPLLGLRPLMGRPFTVEEEKPEHGDVVLVSERLWRERLGSDPAVLNHPILLGGRSFTVVGVMPARLKLFDPAEVQGWDKGFGESDLWRPLPVQSGLARQRSYRAFLVLGRLKPGVSLEGARAEMAILARRQAEQFPDSNAGWGITVEPWNRTVVRGARRPLLLLLAAVGVVLLIATANLANLSLARASARRKEVAVRLALGAGRGRVARQFLTESLLLSVTGGLAGLWLARCGLPLLVRMIPASVPRAEETALDGRVLAFTLSVSMVVGALAGLAPVLGVWRDELNTGMKLALGGLGGKVGGHRLREWLVVAQVALVMILLSGAGLLTRSFARLCEVNPGFRPGRLVAMDLAIVGRESTNGEARIAGVRRLLDRLGGAGAAETFAAVDGLPLDSGHGNMDIALTSIEGTSPAGPDEKRIAGLRLASAGYFPLMGIPLARGRLFSERDNGASAGVVIINEELARRYFSGVDPVGKRMASPDFGMAACEVVGVVKDVRHAGLETAPLPEVFRPLLQECFSSVTIVAGGEAPADVVFRMVRSATEASALTWPVWNPRPLERLVDESLAPRRLSLILMAVFAVVAVVMAMAGIYGVLSCVVGERGREFGIRQAIGARPFDILVMVLGRGMRSVALGGGLGLIAAIEMGRMFRLFLFEVSPTDPFVLTVVSFLLVAIGLAGCWFPARRATRVDPMEALRTE